MDPAGKKLKIISSSPIYSYIGLQTIVNKKVKVLSWSDLLPSYLFTGF